MRVRSCSVFAEAAFLPHALGVGGHFLDRFDIGRKPREAVGRALLGFELVCAEPPILAHPVAHGVERAVQKAPGGEVSLTGKMVERHRGRLSFGLAPLLRRSMRRGRRRCNASFGGDRLEYPARRGSARRRPEPK